MYGKNCQQYKKIEHISGRPIDVAKNGMKFPTGSLDHIMLSETIHSNLESDLQRQFKAMHIPQILYTEDLYGIPSKPKMKKCQVSHRTCIQCTKTH